MPYQMGTTGRGPETLELEVRTLLAAGGCVCLSVLFVSTFSFPTYSLQFERGRSRHYSATQLPLALLSYRFSSWHGVLREIGTVRLPQPIYFLQTLGTDYNALRFECNQVKVFKSFDTRQCNVRHARTEHLIREVHHSTI